MIGVLLEIYRMPCVNRRCPFAFATKVGISLWLERILPEHDKHGSRVAFERAGALSFGGTGEHRSLFSDTKHTCHRF